MSKRNKVAKPEPVAENAETLDNRVEQRARYHKFLEENPDHVIIPGEHLTF